jgi:Xaa-Pro aminopeptidase
MRGLLLFGDTIRSPALRHEVPLAILGPLLLAEVGARKYVLTSFLERDRVVAALPGVEVLDYFDFGWKALVADGMTDVEADREVVTRVVRQMGISDAIVPGDFPVGVADRLRQDGITLTIDDVAIQDRRRAKSGVELAGIRAAQRAAEAGMTAARDLLSRARPTEDGQLDVDGRRLRSEDVRAALRAACAELDAPCPPEMIVTSVWSGNGHEPGSGPLPSGLPIVVDIWPRDEASGCWADMTRTFVVGASRPEQAGLIAEHARVVRAALEQARTSVRPGITGRALFDLTCDVFESAGYRTQRTTTDADDDSGFQSWLGHGVGLDVHEPPGLGPAGREALVAGDVVAIEPGLWHPVIGEVRFEDLILVTETGGQTLTDFPYEIAVSG